MVAKAAEDSSWRGEASAWSRSKEDGPTRRRQGAGRRQQHLDQTAMELRQGREAQQERIAEHDARSSRGGTSRHGRGSEETGEAPERKSRHVKSPSKSPLHSSRDFATNDKRKSAHRIGG